MIKIIVGLAILALVIWFISMTAMWFGVIGYAFFAMIIFAIWFIVAYRKYSADKKEYDAVAKRRYDYEEIIKNSLQTYYHHIRIRLLKLKKML